ADHELDGRAAELGDGELEAQRVAEMRRAEELATVLTIGKPMRRSRCISWNGRPTASRNQSSTTPPTMSKKFTKYTMPAGSQCEKRINRSRANGAATRKRKPSSPRGASLQNAVEPGERQQPGDEHQARRRSGEEGADLGLL